MLLLLQDSYFLLLLQVHLVLLLLMNVDLDLVLLLLHLLKRHHTIGKIKRDYEKSLLVLAPDRLLMLGRPHILERVRELRLIGRRVRGKVGATPPTSSVVRQEATVL